MTFDFSDGSSPTTITLQPDASFVYHEDSDIGPVTFAGIFRTLDDGTVEFTSIVTLADCTYSANGRKNP